MSYKHRESDGEPFLRLGGTPARECSGARDLTGLAQASPELGLLDVARARQRQGKALAQSVLVEARV